jgi:hypothetical protein
MAELTRFELATFRVTGGRSNQLSYSSKSANGSIWEKYFSANLFLKKFYFSNLHDATKPLAPHRKITDAIVANIYQAELDTKTSTEYVDQIITSILACVAT